MTGATDSDLPAVRPLRADVEVIGLIGVAHGASHFYQLAIPPLFPFLREEFGLSWMMLGVITTVFFVVSGAGQALAGFIVDRFGSRRTLIFGMASMGAGAAVVALAGGYVSLLIAAALIGLGNCVMHPADYSVLNSKISTRRIGHAFSVHGLSGNLGYAAAPAIMLPLATLYGWRMAIGSAALLGVLVIGLILIRPQSFEVQQAPAAALDSDDHPVEGARLTGLPRWLTPSVILCFLFFVAVTLAGTGLQNFAPQSLRSIYGISAATATGALTLYLIAGACGMFAGGFAATASSRHERIAMGALLGCSCLLLLLASGVTPEIAVVPMLGFAGFLMGILSPSRDMLVRKAAPVKSSGRVFGVVYSGIDVGGAMGPAILGFLLDHQQPGAAIAIAACSILVGVIIAAAIARSLALRA